ncbi:MAG TPA: 50S ribosomal protein L4 [Planctomycetota bacterium]|jgi:large subunit ribosomal protein L4|nr:50S ribosomal protein L4 [Planctomycetota bacterium]
MASFAVRLFDCAAGEARERTVDGAPFGERFLSRTLRDAVLMYEANRRQGTVNTKERGDVAGTTKKPWKQKHTGRARAGSKKSPLWRKGGTIFGPHPRDHSYRLPRVELRVALRTALLGKLRDGEVTLLQGLSFDAPSAKKARGLLASLGGEGRSLLVLPGRDRNAWLSFRNFRGVEVRTADEVNAYDICAARNVLCLVGAWERLEARIAPREEAAS